MLQVKAGWVSVCNREGFEPFSYKCIGTHCVFQVCLLIFEFLDGVGGFFNGNIQ